MVRAIKTTPIVKKRTKRFIRFQSDRYDRVKVCRIKVLVNNAMIITV